MALTSAYTEAKIRGVSGKPVVGQPGDVHTSAQNEIGARALDQWDNEYVYLQGVASVVAGMAVTFDEAGVTTMLAANAKGPVAWATGAVDATTEFGWFARYGNLLARLAINTADNALLGRETTDGEIGDGRAAGDQIYGVISRGSTGAAVALTKIQTMTYPFVDDIYGS